MSQYEYHKALVTDITFSESRNGNEQIVLEIDVLNNGQSIDMKRRITLTRTPRSKQFVDEKLERIGFWFEAMDNFGWDRESEIDVSMQMKPRMDGDGEYEDWDIAPPRKPAKPMSADKTSRFAEDMRVRFGGGGTAAKSAPPKSSAPPRPSAPPKPSATAKQPEVTNADQAWEWYQGIMVGEANPDEFWKLVAECGGEDNCDWKQFQGKALPF